MEKLGQHAIETLKSQMANCPLECQEMASPSYRAPHVLLVGKAKHLIAGDWGNMMDYQGGYHFSGEEGDVRQI